MTTPTQVRYRDRRTGEIRLEQIPAERALRWLYETALGSRCRSAVFGHRLISYLVGWTQNRAWSRRRIGPFAAAYGIDPGEVELPLDKYPSFNAFFSRRLRPGARPFSGDPRALCSPADGKVLVFPRLTGEVRMPVKGAMVEPSALLAAPAEGIEYRDGACLVVRLSPPDYHRFHFPAAGITGPARSISGRYHSVNPVALARVPGLLSGNARAVTRLATEVFGPIACVEVGAFAVGSIVQTYAPGRVTRGQEKGYFQFGGSTLVLLFRPGAVQFDDDLRADSAAGLETQVRTGTRLGWAGS
ncbi:MAG: archaetidylserine decarboxylase [Candidatus Latescibacterota bacterium]|jgi:phosphatidylserine decarboxylase